MSRGGLIVFFAAALAMVSWSAQTKPSESSLIQAHLNQAISWYRQVAALDITAGQPSDTLYLENARNSASQALQLAFEAASAQAQLLAAQKKKAAGSTPAAETPPAADQQQGIAKALSDTAKRVADLQSQITDLNTQIAKATAARRVSP